MCVCVGGGGGGGNLHGKYFVGEHYVCNYIGAGMFFKCSQKIAGDSEASSEAFPANVISLTVVGLIQSDSR